MIITAFNPDVESLERTYLTLAESAGVTAHTVKNNDRFVADDRVMIGEMGHEKTEVVTVSSVSGGTTITTTATVFSHEPDDPITRLRFDRVIFYRSTTGSSGTYSSLGSVALDVDNANFITTYDDTTGLSSYFYKVSYLNSVSTLESSLSDPIPGGGYGRNTVGYMIDEVLREAQDLNEQFTDRIEILGWFNECSDDLTLRVKRPFDFLKTRTTLARVANTNYVDFPTDSNGNQTIWKFDRMDYNFVDTTTNPDTDVTYPVRVISLPEYRERFQDNTINSTTVNDEVQLISLDIAMNRFRIWPPAKTNAGAVWYMYYWKFFSTLDSEADVFETPTPRIYKLFALGKFFRKKSQTDSSQLALSDRYYADYNAEVAKLRKGDGMDAGSPKSFKFKPQDYKGNRNF